jgi:hypothetical protein
LAVPALPVIIPNLFFRAWLQIPENGIDTGIAAFIDL